MPESIARHDEDGQPYIAYYRRDAVTGFIWSGDDNDPVQVTREMGEPVIDTFTMPHAVLATAWKEAFGALQLLDLEADADHPVAARYRAASDALNHANRRREHQSAVEALRQFRLACDTYLAQPMCAEGDQVNDDNPGRPICRTCDDDPAIAALYPREEDQT